MQYDSTQDTLAHIRRVQTLLHIVIANLATRAINHDTSKLEEPEKSGFDEFTPKLKACTYGSEEYKGYLKQLNVVLGHHYAVNSHHPEHYGTKVCEGCTSVPLDYVGDCPKCGKNDFIIRPSVASMTLLDVVEMFCDWKAATERHADGSLMKSIQINMDRFRINPQLAQIFENTAKELGWVS